MSQKRMHKIGLDANAPIDGHSGRLAPRLVDPEIIAGAGAAWVRINFILGPWSRPKDPAPHNGGRNWLQTYQAIVDQYLERGMNIYGLIGHESVKSSVGLPDFFRDHRDQTADRSRAERWIADYVDNFQEIVQLFQNKIQIFESFNEPDDWHNQQRAWIHPTWYAVMLTEIYRRIKIEVGIDSVKLISGPLQGLEINKNEAPTKYLRDAYAYGKEHLGWGRSGMPYPFDGVGYHLYIKEDFNSNWAIQEAEVRQTYRQYIEGMLQVIQTFEGPDNGQKLYISEIGWHSNGDTPAEKEFQAKNLKLALELMIDDPAVALSIWFCTEDFAHGEKFYGLYQMGRATPQGRKPAYHTYKSFCDSLLAAHPAVESRPTLEPARLRTPVSTSPTATIAEPSVAATATRSGQRSSRSTASSDQSATAAKTPTIFEQLAQLKDQVAQIQSELQRLPAQSNAPAVNMGPISQELAQLRNQSAELQGQMATLQGQVQQLSAQQARLQGQMQQIQSRSAAEPGTDAGTIPVSSSSTSPGVPGRPAPLIQDITPQLKRHPTLRFESRTLDQIQRIIIHHTAISSTIGAERIANYGVDSKGWPGFRYHYFITGDGQIQQTNALTTLSTHAGPYSSTSIGVGFAGNFTDAIPTPAQIDAGTQLVAWLLRRFNLSIQAVTGYKELINTQSPGLQWDAGDRWGDQLKGRIQSYL